MKHRTVLILHAAVAAALAAVSLAIPGPFLRLFGMTSGATEQLLVRFFGASLLGIGLLGWLGRDADEPRIAHGLALTLFVTDVAIALVCFLGTATGLMASLGWSIFGLFVLLASGVEKRVFARRP